jgi:hypothetical protein
LSIYSLIPFAVITITSLIIIVKFKRMNQNYYEFVSSPNHFYNKSNYLRKIRKNRQTSLMLLNSNIYFFVSNLQYWICFFVFSNQHGQNSELHKNYNSFSHIFLYTNNAFEFLIFSFSSQQHRKELYSLFF